MTVKIEDAKKRKLDEFLAALLLQHGIKISLQEALGLFVDYALENQDAILRRLRDLPPLEEDPAWKALENPKHWGVKDSSEMIDEFLYGR